jgi:hypothetical protein
MTTVGTVTVMTPDEANRTKGGSSMLRRGVRWMFANRRTGGITIAQWPNVALSVFIALSIARRYMFQRGTSETTLRVLSVVVLIVWAVDEFVWGVNPFRRIIGVVVLLTTVSSVGLLAR